VVGLAFATYYSWPKRAELPRASNPDRSFRFATAKAVPRNESTLEGDLCGRSDGPVGAIRPPIVIHEREAEIGDPFIHVFVSLNFNALDPSTWIPVETQITHPSLPPCPPPVGCDPTSTGAFQAGDPEIVDLGLVFLSRPVQGVEPADLATPMTLESPKAAGAPMTFVGYGFPEPRGIRPFSEWDGLRRIKVSTLDKVLNDVWASWSLPGVVCSGDSGGATFFNRHTRVSGEHERLAVVASDGGLDCMSKDIRVRLDSPPRTEMDPSNNRRSVNSHQ
jgi:hypothetical protein